MARRTGNLLLILLLAAGCGCVERRMTIRTVPADADLYLDGRHVGKSPVTIPFTHYGTRELVARKAGYHTMRELKVLEPPAFQEFPWDIYYETMTSDVYKDERSYEMVLEPNDPADTSRERVDAKIAEATEIRNRGDG